MRSLVAATIAAVLLAAAAVHAAAPAAAPDLTRAQRELDTAQRTRDAVAQRLGQREAELAHRVRVLYKLTRAGHAPLWTDAGARTDLTRRRAAARRLILRDLEERHLLRDELERADTQAARLERDVLALAASTPPALPARALLPPVGGRRTGDYGATIDPVTRARIVSRGVSWRTIEGAVVSAPVAGTVVFTGPLRGLGRCVLLDGGGGITVLISGVSTLDPQASVGAALAAGARLGVAGAGQVGLELRRDGRTADPTPFLSNPR
jgi:septal ring factor EnvC (AmiA/AmiB activator)